MLGSVTNQNIPNFTKTLRKLEIDEKISPTSFLVLTEYLDRLAMLPTGTSAQSPEYEEILPLSNKIFSSNSNYQQVFQARAELQANKEISEDKKLFFNFFDQILTKDIELSANQLLKSVALGQTTAQQTEVFEYFKENYEGFKGKSAPELLEMASRLFDVNGVDIDFLMGNVDVSDSQRGHYKGVNPSDYEGHDIQLAAELGTMAKEFFLRNLAMFKIPDDQSLLECYQSLPDSDLDDSELMLILMNQFSTQTPLIRERATELYSALA